MITIYIKDKTFGTCPHCNEQLPYIQSSFHFNPPNNARPSFTEGGWIRVIRPNTRGSGNDIWIFNPDQVLAIEEYMEEYTEEEETTK